MSAIIDGSNTFDFSLSDNNGNNHYYEIVTKGSLKDAEDTAQKLFTETYGHKASHIEEDVTGYPLTQVF